MKIKQLEISEISNVQKYLDTASSSASDNGLTTNYKTVVLPIIEEKKIPSNGRTFGAFVTLLFDNDGNFVKTGNLSIGATQRTVNVFDGKEIPDEMQVSDVFGLPTAEIIKGSNRTNGKSALETVAGWFNNKEVIKTADKKANVLQVGFTEDTGQPTMQGARIRERNLFTSDKDETIYNKIPEILKELFNEANTKLAEKFFNTAGIDYPKVVAA